VITGLRQLFFGIRHLVQDERAEKYMKDKERMEKVTLALNTAITKIGNLTSATLEKISQV
jgi:hypothetical protein